MAQVEKSITVQAPAWIKLNRVEVIGNSETLAEFDFPFPGGGIQFDETVPIPVEQDTWFVVIASGEEPMAPALLDGDFPITPLAFTNPVRVDADGNGIFDAPRADELATSRSGETVTVMANMATLLLIPSAFIWGKRRRHNRRGRRTIADV